MVLTAEPPIVSPHRNGTNVTPIETPLADFQPSGEIRILVLDDDHHTCQLAKAVLNNQGFIIDTLSDPLMAEQWLKDQSYHLILLDYVIPGLDPDTVFGWIHQYQTEASVIVVTAYPTVESATSSLRARAYDYLTKPFQVDQLRKLVIRCLENKGLLRMTEAALRESLGAVIRDKRKLLKLTLQQMSQRTGVSLGYLSQIELGKNSASIETLYRISLALGLRMSDLFQTLQRGSGV
jgi:DNA-binding response OmpR family regulator